MSNKLYTLERDLYVVSTNKLRLFDKITHRKKNYFYAYPVIYVMFE